MTFLCSNTSVTPLGRIFVIDMSQEFSFHVATQRHTQRAHGLSVRSKMSPSVSNTVGIVINN
jgi:hypothetical protein